MDGDLCRKLGRLRGVVGFSLTIRRTSCVPVLLTSEGTIGPLQSRYSECQISRLF